METFLQTIAQKREGLKRETFWLQNTPKEVSELFLSLLSELTKKYLTQLNTKEGIELSIPQIYKDIKSILTQLQANLKLQNNVFSQDIELFLKHFITPNTYNEKTGKTEEKGLQYTEFMVQKILWNQIDTKKEFSTLYDMMTSSIWVVLDESKLSSQDISKKLSILKQIPQVETYIKENPDFDILFTIISKIGNNLDTPKSIAFFQWVKWEFLTLLFSDPKDNPEKYTKTRISFLSKMMEYIKGDIFWSLKNYDKQTQREVMGSFFQLSFLKGYTSHPLYQIAHILQGNDQIDQIEIYQDIFSLLWIAIRNESMNQDGNFNHFIDNLAKNFTKLTEDEQTQVLTLLKSLIPKDSPAQNTQEYKSIDWKTDSKGQVLSKFFSNTKVKAANAVNNVLEKGEQFFIKKGVDFLAPSKDGGKNNLLSDESYRKVVWESLKKLWTVFSDDFTLSIREVILTSLPEKIQLKQDTQVLRIQNGLSESIVKRISDILKQKISIALEKYQNGSLESSKLSREEFLNLVESIIKVEIQKENLSIPPELTHTLITTLWKELLNDYSQDSNPINKLFDTRLAYESAGETLSKVNIFVDSLYTLFWEKNSESSKQGLVNTLLKQYHLSELEEVKILWKSFPQFLTEFVKNIDSWTLKTFLFEKQNSDIIQKILSPKVTKTEKGALWKEFSLRLLKKFPQSETLLMDSLIESMYTSFWWKEPKYKAKDIEPLLRKYMGKEILEVRVFWKSIAELFSTFFQNTDKNDVKVFFHQKENKEIFHKLIDSKISKNEKTELGTQLWLSVLTLIKPNEQESREQRILEDSLGKLSPKEIKTTAKFLSQYAQNAQKVLALYDKKLKNPNITLTGADMQDVSRFADSSFSLVSHFVRLYWEETLGLFENKKLFYTLSWNEKVEKLLWGVSEGIKNQNTFSALGSFISAGFNEKQAKNRFFIEYFSSHQNKEPFKNILAQVFQRNTPTS